MLCSENKLFAIFTNIKSHVCTRNCCMIGWSKNDKTEINSVLGDYFGSLNKAIPEHQFFLRQAHRQHCTHCIAFMFIVKLPFDSTVAHDCGALRVMVKVNVFIPCSTRQHWRNFCRFCIKTGICILGNWKN